MSSNCVAGCLVTAPDFSFGGCGLLDAIRSGYIKNFMALRCDESITDITDTVELQALIDANTLFPSPTLTGEVPFPTTGDELTENCQAPQPTSRTYAFNFTSYRVDNTAQTDFTKWETVSSSLTTWYIAPVTCDNILLVPQDFSTGGVFFEMRGTISNVFPNENAMSYQGQLIFKYSSILNGIQLTDAVVEVLGLGSTTVT